MPRKRSITLVGPLAEAMVLEQMGTPARTPNDKRMRLLLTIYLSADDPSVGAKILQVLETQGLDGAYSLLPTGRKPAAEGGTG
jgi:hypothetical protein